MNSQQSTFQQNSSTGFQDMIRCPVTQMALEFGADGAKTKDGSRRYRVSPSGIPVLTRQEL